MVQIVIKNIFFHKKFNKSELCENRGVMFIVLEKGSVFWCLLGISKGSWTTTGNPPVVSSQIYNHNEVILSCLLCHVVHTKGSSSLPQNTAPALPETLGLELSLYFCNLCVPLCNRCYIDIYLY